VSDVLIIDGVRTPRGKGKSTGALHPFHPQELLGQVLTGVVARTGVDAGDIEDVVVGNGDHTGDHANDIARLAVLTAGLPVTVPGVTLNRFCGSGQQAAMFAAMGIASGWQHVVIAGGVESMSRLTVFGQPLDAGNQRLRERYPLVPQGIAADVIATQEGFSRAAVDEFAVRSQERAAKAIGDGRFARSMMAVRDPDGSVALDHDEHPRPGTTLDQLARLAPSFAAQGTEPREPDGRSFDQMCLDLYPEVTQINHVHHAGNSSGVVDGAAALLMTSRDYATAHGLQPRARIVAGSVVGTEPVIMLTAPGPAAEACLGKVGMSVSDIDLWEINEAFAAVPMKMIRDLKIDDDLVNVNGGAIALGHPIGATGAILIQTLIDELERRDLERGLVAMCTGAGMGTATIIERV
jgi:acetyl-CoA C-acetyltransferase